jgi:hypothetical protein
MKVQERKTVLNLTKGDVILHNMITYKKYPIILWLGETIIIIMVGYYYF